MRLFMKESVEKSMKDFEEGLENYFATSRQHRSRKRRGSIILLDKTEDMFDFFNFLSDKCGLDLSIIRVLDEQSARKAIEDLGEDSVKAVVIESSMVDESLNGGSLVCWLQSNYSTIPVWISNCEDEKRDLIRSQTMKIGIIEKNTALDKIVEILGFPKECENMVSQYAT